MTLTRQKKISNECLSLSHMFNITVQSFMIAGPLLAYPVAELAVDFFCNESTATIYLKSDTNSFYVSISISF